MQSGRTDRARAALAEAARLDPFNKRSTFSLTLLEEMKEWRTFEGRHFVVRCKPGPDEVVAAMMPDALDRMHADVAARFGHEPAERTVIELMPDHRMFGVRITGMPWIHTMAACTGPVIALEVPREGARRSTWASSTGWRCCATSTRTPSPSARPATAFPTG